MLKVKVVSTVGARGQFEDDLAKLLNSIGPASVQYRPEGTRESALVIYEEKETIDEKL